MENDPGIKALLQPLRAESSELFVQKVMRKVRTLGEEEGIRWAIFARWAFPALALSFSSFTAVMVYTSEPVHSSTEALLLVDRETSLSEQWLSKTPNEDQILDAAVARP